MNCSPVRDPLQGPVSRAPNVLDIVPGATTKRLFAGNELGPTGTGLRVSLVGGRRDGPAAPAGFIGRHQE
jgi:hypothetical protein